MTFKMIPESLLSTQSPAQYLACARIRTSYGGHDSQPQIIDREEFQHV